MMYNLQSVEQDIRGLCSANPSLFRLRNLETIPFDCLDLTLESFSQSASKSYCDASVCTDDLFDYIGPSYNPPSDDEDFEDDEGSVDTDDLNAFGNRLYNNARITQQESTVLIFSYICRHNLTKGAQNDLLKLLLQCLPKDVPDKTMPRFVYLLRKS